MLYFLVSLSFNYSTDDGFLRRKGASKFCEVKFMHLITVLIKHCPKHICGERVAGCTTGADPSEESHLDECRSK